MQINTSDLYEFGPFHLDLNERLVLRDGCVVPLSPKVFDTLLVLVQNSGRILGKDELMQMIWPDTFVEESNLTQNISQIRRALGDDCNCIETIPRRGYRFVFPVQFVKRELRNTSWTGNGSGLDLVNPRNGSSSSIITTSKPSTDNAIENPQDESNQRILVALFLVGLVIMAMAYFVAPRHLLFSAKHESYAFRLIDLVRLATAGEPLQTALSHDGKYVAYVEGDGDRQSLWIRQVSTTSGVRVVAPAEVVFNGVTFAPDDGFLYYVTRPKNEIGGSLFQVPVLGGAPKQLMTSVHTPVALSPDGRSVAFVRNYPAQDEMSLITARVDGSDERRLLTRTRPEMLSFMGPSWSPDGEVIACAEGSIEGVESKVRVLAVSVSNGSTRPIGDRAWTFIGQVAWLGDGSGIVFHAWSRSSAVYGDPLWLLNYPEGEARPITNDLTNYEGVSISSDSRALVTRRINRASHILIVPVEGSGPDVSQARQLRSSSGDNFSEALGMDWTPDGRLVYASQASGNLEIWAIAANGQSESQMTRDPASDLLPTTSTSGRYIVFVSDRSGRSNIWRMDLDGGNPKQLTHGRGDFSPSLSPDGQWLVYSSWGNGSNREEALWKTPIDGGEPVRMAQNSNPRPTISPDGKWIAYSYRDSKDYNIRVAVLPFAGGEPRILKGMASADFGLIRWSPDSRALTYIDTREGVSNIWSLPIDGGEAKQLTRFTTDRIFRFAWANDGKYLACERGLMIKDIVLITTTSSQLH
jgi:eukaryotic-like serine/threonine-protein kinase